ncbi:maleylpyruvate isomerase family mycothiol-dependent enzyme [Mycobacterium sp. 94-17]|uniref:maleylpyruvate isomerase family mycothiol-dependent enzyme n=1 Tax=Mycobacterium sp. 94-17 TaxID=2986147 RepID=UPI002D1EF734|nr:maleylpyruvate isomerase family mycothiol-dependent enzyme [Mycobacterium sp. 94-17]MEB4209526.1 maleylpyruvate isomerase family mycothiol-dependent enzyme [Mycobacterium sp. 94-17]
MSATLDALAEERRIVLDLCSQMPDWVWAEDSGCPGWSVQDLVSHMACSFWLAVDPSTLPSPGEKLAERAADLYVDSRRSMSPEEVVADYESVSARGMEVLAAIEGQDVDIPIGDVGTYPASVVPTTFVFEAVVHTRYDLFAPAGPLENEPPPVDELSLAPTLDWIEAALPQQNMLPLNDLPAGVEICLDGLCARTLRLGGHSEGHSDVAARVTSDSQAFVRWITQRGTWDALGAAAEGDPSSLDVVRRLRVF